MSWRRTYAQRGQSSKKGHKSPKNISSSLTARCNSFTLEDFISGRDYVGALTFLEFQPQDRSTVDNYLWRGYCAFHNQEYSKAQDIYIELLSGNYDNTPDEVPLFLACVYSRSHMYKEAWEATQEGPDCDLKDRLIFFLMHYKSDEGWVGKNDIGDKDSSIESYRQMLGKGPPENLLCLAAMKYTYDQQYQNAIDIYKKVVSENREYITLNFYIAMCYFKMVR